MATEEKLLKSLESLIYTDDGIPQRNKERIQNCLYAADTISSSMVKVLPNFHQHQSTMFEILFKMCDDADSDVRLVAEESLNKIIKAMDNDDTNKVLIELHREIKKNGPARSLRAALWRFSNLADLIRLTKRKQYLINSIPCIVHMAQRNEEVIHETLADSLPRILKSLGNFLTDGDVKTLLKAFLKNVNNPSAVIRRASVNCLLATCVNCRRPYTFLLYLFDTLLDLTTNSRAADICLVLGVLSGFKQLMPYIKNMPLENRQEIQGSFGIIKRKKQVQVNTEKLIQLFEICLHFLSCAHDSVMCAALDTLNSLLINCTPEAKNLLLSTDGIRNNSLILPLHLHLEGGPTTPTDSLSRIGSVADDDDGDSTCVDNMLTIKNIRKSSFQDIDIGTLKDSDIPLIFCVRLICKTCLLTGENGGTISDTKVRISVKNLALTCLVSLFRLYPKGFLQRLPKSDPGNKQPIADVLLLASHTDPQLRGVIRIVVASFIKAVLIESNGRWFSSPGGSDLVMLTLDRLVSFLIEGLLDSSSTCVRQSLTGLNLCLKHILNSSSFTLAIPILELLPAVMKNSHWLVKVKLLDVISGIPSFLSVHSIRQSEHFQNALVFGVVFELLRDDDQRMRTAASNAIVRLVPSLYLPRRKAAPVAAIERIPIYFFEANWCDQVDGGEGSDRNDLPFPFNALGASKEADVEVGLSKIVYELHRLLLENFADNALYGYVESLCYLSSEYPSTVYNDAWHTVSHHRYDLCNVVHSLLQQEFIYDINCHVHVLQLCGNLLSGRCVENLGDIDDSPAEANRARLPWGMFAEKRLQEMCESFLTHLVKLLNILVHIIDDVPLATEQKATTTTLTSIAAAASSSPVKSKKSSDGDKNVEKKTATEEGQPEGGGEKKSEPTKATGMGHFSSSAHYLKIYDVLKVAYDKYKISLNCNDNIVLLTEAVLKAQSQILEIATVTETSRIADEILGYLHTIFHLVPSATVHTVHQLLKSLFGSNLTMSLGSFGISARRRIAVKTNATTETATTITLHQVLLNRFHHENALPNVVRPARRDSLHKGSGSETSPVFLKHSRNPRELQRPSKSDKMLAGYIRLFEPMVIKSLKHYTITSNVELQCAVLHLLNQLVRLKVNYCLLDSEQVFIKFIQKQFEFIEEGLIAEPAKLIPKVFQFLTNLSHGKQHSKSIIAVPKVIQLCDGLMASGQPPLTYCIPALRPIVEELFLVRNRPNAADFDDELETTREVLLSMLLRLFEYADVMDLLAAILKDNRRSGNADKLSKWSKLVFDVFLVQLAGDKLKLDNGTAMLSMMKLLTAVVDQASTRTVGNELLVLLFRRFPAKDESEAAVSSWLGKILTILIMIIRLEENVVLKGIRESSGNFAPECVFDRVSVKSDPLNVTNVGTCFAALTADTILVKFFFRVLELISGKCRSIGNEQEEEQDCCFLVEQLSHLLLILAYVFRAGNHRILVGCASRLLEQQCQLDLKNITANLVEVSIRFPPIAYQWCSILAALECRSTCFWEMFMDCDRRDTVTTQNSFEKLVPSPPQDPDCLYRALPKTMATIALCEHLAGGNYTEPDELLTCLIARESHLMTWLSEEPPVSDVIRYVHENPQLSARFLHSVSTSPTNNLQPHVQIKLLNALRDCHPGQTGRSIRFLVKNLLDRRHLALMRTVMNLTCRKLEYLLTLDNDDIKEQLPKEDLRDIIDHIVRNDLARKNDTIVGLLAKVAHQVYNCDPFEPNYRGASIVDTIRLRTLMIDRGWYLSQLTSKRYLHGEKSGQNVASAFSRIEVGSVTAMSDEYSKRLVLRSVLSCAGRFPTNEIETIQNSLLTEAVQAGFSDLQTFVRLLPSVHQVYLPQGRGTFSREKTYALQIDDVFANKAVWRDLQTLLSVAKDCATYSKPCRHGNSLVSMNLSLLIRFCVVSLESILYTLSGRQAPIYVDHIERVLTCVDEIVSSSPNHLYIIGLNSHLTWLSSFVNVLFKIVSCLCPRAENDPPHLEDYFPPVPDLSDDESHTVAKHAVCQLATVFTMIVVENRTKNVPELIRKTVTSLTMRLAKLSAFNSYLSTPPSIWRGNHPWTIEFGGPFRTEVPPLPVEFLRDADILEDYNFRISRIGWSNRQQFEETWMSLLSTLNSSLIEDNESGHLAIRFAVKAVTALLARTFYEPTSDGNNDDLTVSFHVSRDGPIDAKTTNKNIEKLKFAQEKFERCFKNETDFLRSSNLVLNVFYKPNVEKCENTRHGCGQVCVAYLLLSSGGAAEESVNDYNLGKIYEKRRGSLERCGLDLNSCIQSLLDLYSLWINTENNTRSLTVLDEILKSLLVISDLFQQRSQWVWLLDTCVELSKDPTLENEITYQYLIVAICKSVALLSPDMETYELIKKLLNQYIKSANFNLRISCLHGLLYVIEGCVLTNTVIRGISEELQLLLPIATEYLSVQNNWNISGAPNQAPEHHVTAWALIFFIIENIPEECLPPEFLTVSIQAVISILKAKSIPLNVYSSLMKALERIMVKSCLPLNLREHVTKLAVDKIKDGDALHSLFAVQLLLTCMYSDRIEDDADDETTNNENTNDNSPDDLVQIVEKVSVIFDRIRKGVPFEVEILCQILPDVINDFFSPSDILTKVVGEFLSPQQKHPGPFAGVVFQVFENGIARSHLTLLQDWVVVSLSNFAQTVSVGMATWYLTCFFVSTSTNFWLRSVFPHVRSRIGRLEAEDVEMLCVAGRDFYINLTTEKQRQIFVDAFDKTELRCDTPFKDLLECIKSGPHTFNV